MIRYKILTLLLLAASLMASAQNTAGESYTVNDTVFNPKLVFSGLPQQYEIAGIKVTGAENYDDTQVINYTGFAVGQRIGIPGEDTKRAVQKVLHSYDISTLHQHSRCHQV